MDPVEDLDLPSFSDEDSTDDMEMELEHGNDELFANAELIGQDANRPLSPNVNLQYPLADNEETIGPGILPEMPWHDPTKIVERWLQMYQV
jgi:hypothetical protein